MGHLNTGDLRGQTWPSVKADTAEPTRRLPWQRGASTTDRTLHRPSTAPRVLLVHANDRYCATLAAHLRTQKLSVIEFDDPRAALLFAESDRQINAVLIDADLPKVSGIGLLVRFRNLTMELPTALAAGANDEKLEETALECGASDFLHKFRSPMIGAKRVRLLVGGSKSVVEPERPPRRAVTVGNLDLRLPSHRAHWRNVLVPLTVTEFRIVRLLACRVGEEVSYREIYDVVHGPGFMAGDGQYGFRGNVRSLIRKIRNRFRTIDEHFSEIENYPGFGYRWRGLPFDPAARTAAGAADPSLHKALGFAGAYQGPAS